MLGRRAPLLRGLQPRGVHARGVGAEPRALAVLPRHSAKALGSTQQQGVAPLLDIEPPQHRRADRVGPRPCTACSGAPCSVYTVVTTLSTPFITSGNLRHSAQVFHPPLTLPPPFPNRLLPWGFPPPPSSTPTPPAPTALPTAPSMAPAPAPVSPPTPATPPTPITARAGADR